jgi:hypothetical protein
MLNIIISINTQQNKKNIVVQQQPKMLVVLPIFLWHRNAKECK